MTNEQKEAIIHAIRVTMLYDAKRTDKLSERWTKSNALPKEQMLETSELLCLIFDTMLTLRRELEL